MRFKVIFKTILSVTTGFVLSASLCAQTEIIPEAQKKYDDAYALGAKYYQDKKFDLGIKALTTAAASQADNGTAGILLGYCYYQKKQYSKALKQYLDVSEHARSISKKNEALKLAQRLDTYMKGICPGNCLKPSMQGWHKMTVAGCPDRLVWMVYPYLDPAGKGGSEYWSNDHMGEVIEYVNGRPVNKGKCPICGGTGKVSLP